MDGLDFAGESAPVAAGTVTLLFGSTFALSKSNGDIDSSGTYGFFAQDTRLLSRWCLEIDGAPPEVLTQELQDPWRGRFVARVISGGSRLLVDRRRQVGKAMREEIAVENLTREPCSITVRVGMSTDFASLFAVKEGRVATPPKVISTGDGDSRTFARDTEGDRSAPPLTVRIDAPGASFDSDGLSYDVELEPRGRWHCRLEVVPLLEGQPPTSWTADAEITDIAPALSQREWESQTSDLHAESPAFNLALQRSKEDLGSLRIFDTPSGGPHGAVPEQRDRPGGVQAPDSLPVVAAGSPWFMTLFGRDSLLASYMTLALDPTLALGVLRALSSYQGTKVDPETEEQPGRILHEVRFDDHDQVRGGRQRIYYGTADATPLFVALLGEYARWHGPTPEVAALLPAADRALAWVDEYGDRDGDGFVEYCRMTPDGLVNQGWKDSWDGVTFADGTIAEAPIALCEVQGYVYAAFRARSVLAELFGDAATAAHWRGRADVLKEAYNRRFWLADKGWFALGLDKDKKPIDALASNMGQALWTGIVSDELAPQVAHQLTTPEMFSGWGVRTLATSMCAYDPLSYHNGSVWPHDTALIAYGLMRHGFVDEAQRIALGLLDLAEAVGGRLPELLAGLDRQDFPRPVPYPTACSPQAWASAAPVHLLRALVGLEPAVHRSELRVRPRLPEALGAVHLAELPLAGGRIDIRATGNSIQAKGLPPRLKWVVNS
jgi:glycogen debranching enzyme